MVVLITERQFRFLTEQEADTWDSGITPEKPSINKKGQALISAVNPMYGEGGMGEKMAKWFWEEASPEELNKVALFCLLVPGYGWLLSMIPSTLSAIKYNEQGDKRGAIVTAFLSLIPGVVNLGVSVSSKLLSLLRNSSFMTRLGEKIIGNIKNFTTDEILVLKFIEKNLPQLVKNIVDNVKNFTVLLKNKGVQISNSNIAKWTYNKVFPFVRDVFLYTKAYEKGFEMSNEYCDEKTLDNVKVIINNETPEGFSIMYPKYKDYFSYVKEKFGSSGDCDDNMLLKNAWEKGWRPYDNVAPDFQTDTYKKKLK